MMLSAQTLTLEQCLQLAEKGNLTLQVAQGAVEHSEMLQQTAWDVEKTELSFSQDPTSGGSPDNALTLSQTIDFPTRYTARRHQLVAETDVKKSELAVLKNKMQGEIAAHYYTLVYLREKLRILQDQDTILARYEELATKRYDAGEVRRLEPLNAQRMRQENGMQILAAQTEYAQVQAELSALMGTDVLVEPVQMAYALVSMPATMAYNYGTTPEGQYLETQRQLADRAVKLAKTEFLPSLSLGLRTQMVIKAWNPYHVDRGWNDGNFMGFEVGVNFPIFTKATRAKVKAAQKERALLDKQAENEAFSRERAYTIARNRLLAAKTQTDYYNSTASADAEAAVSISAAAYESGEISYLEYVGALQQAVDVRLKSAAAVNDYNQAAVTLQTLAGTYATMYGK